MPKNYPRSERVEQLAREVLSQAVSSLKDPRVGFATVTQVRLSPDLRTARVYISALGDEEERADTIEAIIHAAPHLRARLGHEVRLKYLPVLDIVEDETAQNSERIEQLLRGVGASKPPELEEPNNRNDGNDR